MHALSHENISASSLASGISISIDSSVALAREVCAYEEYDYISQGKSKVSFNEIDMK